MKTSAGHSFPEVDATMADVLELTTDFRWYARTKLGDSLSQIEKCLNLLSSEQVWHRPNDVSNAVGNLVLHLAGNLRQWVIAALGNEPFDRDREAEFAQRDPLPTEEILANLKDAVTRCCHVIDEMTPEQMVKRRIIQTYDVTGQAAVFHAVEHFSLHTGQIVYATKILTGKDLSLYDAGGRRIDGRDSDVP